MYKRWTEEDVGREIELMFEHGTVISDVIVSIPLWVRIKGPGGELIILGDGQPIIGPLMEVGHIIARATIALPEMYRQMQQFPPDDDDDDDGGVPLE